MTRPCRDVQTTDRSRLGLTVAENMTDKTMIQQVETAKKQVYFWVRVSELA
jgi:hypothetical protein